jgi:hypothetical protein
MKNKLDERELMIRGDIFKRMFWILAALVFINGWLAQMFNIVWADTYYSNMIILFTAIAVGTNEMIFRGIWLQNTKYPWAVLLLGICGLFLFVMNIIHLVQGDEFISNGALTDTSGSLIYSLPILSMGIGGAVKIIRDKMNRNEEE